MEQEPQHSSAERRRTAGRGALLIEDSAEHAALIRRHVLRTGLFEDRDVHHATTLAEGIEALRDTRFRIVLLDLSLPDARGLEAVRRVREMCSDVPIVVLTAHRDERIAVQALESGAQEFLQKEDLEASDLRRRIRFAEVRMSRQRAWTDLALRDPLTGLLNRRGLLDVLRRAAERRPPPRNVAVLMVDLDDFKPVNDNHGHPAGDLVLRVVARRLESAVRDGDAVSRVGGDELAVALEDVSEAVLGRVAERVRDAVRAPIRHQGVDLLVTASVGGAIGAHDEEPDALLARADRALYTAKVDKDRVHVEGGGPSEQP